MRTQVAINKYKRVENWHTSSIILALWDLFATHLAYLIALWLRFDGVYSKIPTRYLETYLRSITVYAVLCVILFLLTRLYQGILRYFSLSDALKTICVSMAASMAYATILNHVIRRMPLSYGFWGAFLQAGLVLIMRVIPRLLASLRVRNAKRRVEEDRVMIIGAGSAGQMLIRDLQRAKETNLKPVCVIDDDKSKQGRYIEGIPVVGDRDEILSAARDYHVDRIFLSIPSASAEDRRDILNICSETGCKLQQLPGMYQLALEQVTLSNVRNVTVEDLLGREPIRAEMEEVYSFIQGKIVMVTGGGGSIGSELCRQIAAHQPRQLIILDIYENNAYAIQLELKEKYPQLDLVTLIGSVRDSRKLFQVFSDYRPQIVYHAAAHKHVPLMEDSPCEAIKNNAIGTYKTAYAAMTHGCERFVLISTDKAVNPTNIMGASKRLCEMIIQSFDEKIKAGKANELPQLFTHEGVENADKDGSGAIFRNAKTEFVAVRFGNVLGSNGSVIPIFKKQIESGGPVTVTHPDIIRYFMTIPEAVSLVMLAGTYAHGGEIFVLDMGSPVKIVDLARNLIKLSGYRPDVDIKIEFTGLRPGEKLYEEKLMAEEGLKKTENKLIHIGCPIPFEVDTFLLEIEDLMQAAYSNKEDIVGRVAAIVSTYHPALNNRKVA